MDEAPGFPLLQHEHPIRVRYQETDAQGHVHHTTFVNYFEIGRIEMLRAAGYSYRELEEAGILLVVSELECRYFAPARYDDLLILKTRVVSSKGVRIRHAYEIWRGDTLIVRGSTVVAAVDPDGKVKRLPKWLKVR
jgi:acyl-CoA thioester hydrolase